MDSRFRGNDGGERLRERRGGAFATPNRGRHGRNGREANLIACVGSVTAHTKTGNVDYLKSSSGAKVEDGNE